MFFHIGIHSVGVQTASEESYNSGFNTVLKARHARGGLNIHTIKTSVSKSQTNISDL